jgi:hypothetical protein
VVVAWGEVSAEVDVEDIVKYLQSLEFEVHSVSLDDLKVGNNSDRCDYIYAHNLNERESYAHLRL